MRERFTPATIAVGLVVAVVMVVYVVKGRELLRLRSNAAIFDQHCAFVRGSIQRLRTKLEHVHSPGELKPTSARERGLLEDSIQNALFCMTEQIDADRLVECLLHDDYPCLVEILKHLEQAIPGDDSRDARPPTNPDPEAVP